MSDIKTGTMKAIFEFENDQEYIKYLRSHFTEIAAKKIDFDDYDSLQDAAKDCVIFADAILAKLD